jgi:hypothetical protein
MKPYNHFFLLTILASASISACGQEVISGSTIIPVSSQTPMSITQTSTSIPPTLTQTPFPLLSNVELVSLFEGMTDLPDDLRRTDIVLITLGNIFEDAPVPDAAATQFFTRGGPDAGFSIVTLYQDKADAELALEAIADPEYYTSIPDIGEKAMLNLGDATFPTADLAFIRCHAVAYVRLTYTYKAETAATYAQILDAELQKVACP